MNEGQSSSQRNAETIQPTQWQCFTAALQFLTRIPVALPSAQPAEYYSTAFRGSLVYFPVVGGLVGLFTVLIFLGSMSIGLTPLIAAFIATGCEAFLTGAFHEDAFADTWDAMGGGWTREQILEIMKDSRLGTYGTLALVVGVGLRVTAMATIGERDFTWALVSIVAAASLARIAILTFMATTSPVSNRLSKTNELSEKQPLRNVWLGALLSSPFWVSWIIFDLRSASISLLVLAIVLIWFRTEIMRRVGGTTGDFLGCSAYLTQLIVLLVATVK